MEKQLIKDFLKWYCNYKYTSKDCNEVYYELLNKLDIYLKTKK